MSFVIPVLAIMPKNAVHFSKELRIDNERDFLYTIGRYLLYLSRNVICYAMRKKRKGEISMKKLSKIGLLILALALICAGIVVSVSGAESKDGLVSYVDETGTNMEGSFEEAWANAAPDSTIKLLGNCEMVEKVYLEGKNLTVDIGNHTLISTDVSAFELMEGTTLNVIGNGKIALDGMLATSTKENVTFSIEGTAGTKGIDIVHTGKANNRIVYTEYGTWSFKHLDVRSTVDGKQWHSFFEMRNVSSSTYNCDVDFTFDTVTMVHDAAYVSHPGQFIVNVAGTGHLTILNSTFVTEHSAIKSGIANNLGEEVILIKNSLISCVTDRTTIKDQEEGNFTSRNYAILGMNDSFKGSPKGIVNIEDSFIESNYRTICYENDSGDITDNQANIVNSTIKVLGLNGNDGTENVSRAIILNISGDSSIINIKKSMAGSTGSKQPYAIASEGTRTNIYELTTSKSVGDGFRVVESIGKDGNPVLVSSAESKVYAWVYDPVGNADAPYVLVKRTFATVDGKEVETTMKGQPSASKFAGFDTFRFKNIGIETYNEYLIWKDNKNTGTWEAYESFGNVGGKANANVPMSNFQWEMQGGSYYIASDYQNSYMKYWVDPGTSTAERIKLAGTKGPYWILGEKHASNATDFSNLRTRVAGSARKAVMVVDFDFGTDNGLYPDFGFQFTSRYWNGGTSSSDYGVNSETNGEWLQVRDGGKTITNSLGTTGTNLTEVPSVEFKPENEWNHLSVVFYSDPNYVGGLAYVYLNGELLGTRIYYKPANPAENMYLEGVRFNIPQNNQLANSTICLDNISLRCYTDYVYEGEADGGAKSPEKYMIASAPGKYINSFAAVSGNTYRGADLETLQKKAEEFGTVIRLQKDFNGTIKSNVDIYTNGYEMNLTDESYGANITYDENTGNSLYQFMKEYKDYELLYYWYFGEYQNAEQMKNLDYYLKTSVTLGQLPTYTGSAIPSVKDIEAFVQKVHSGWHSAGDDKVVENIVPITYSMIVANGGVPTAYDANDNPIYGNRQPIYMYPSYSYESPTAYIKNADGTIVDMSYGDLESSQLLKGLEPGETFVLCDDIQIDDSCVNNVYTADKAQYGGGFTYSSSSEMKVIEYTDEQIAAMQEASAKMALDLNGHTISIGHATKRGTLIYVASNVTFSVYSSQPGGKISSVQGQADSTGINGNRILGIHNNKGQDSDPSNSFNVYNAHLKVGTVEVDGEIIPGSNLTLYGCVLVEGQNGDNSCTIEVDGINAVRHNKDSGGAFMVRNYSGTMKISNTAIIAPTSSSVVSAVYSMLSDAAKYLSPEMMVENCIIINNGEGIIDNSGSAPGANVITLKNVVTNGKIEFTNPSKGESNVVIDTGVVAKAINPNNRSRIVYASGVISGKYNQNMNMASLTDAGIFEVLIPAEINSTNVIDYEAKKVYIVEAGKEDLAPDVENASVLTLPMLPSGTGTTSDLVKVTFMGLDGNPAKSEYFVKGGMPTAPEITDYELSDFTTLKFTGEFDKKIAPVNYTTVYNPKYEVVNNVTGLKSSVSFYTSFNINIYVPYEYKSYLKRATANGMELEIKDVVVDGVQYVMCSAPVTPDKFASKFKFSLGFDEASLDVVYKGTCEITTSVLDYAKAILSDTDGLYKDADKALVYAALNYANEAILYANSEENEAVSALVEEYKSYAAAEPEDKYTEAFEQTNLSAAFLKATVKLDSAPAIVFTLRRDFRGVVNFTINGETKTFNVNANNERTITLDGLSISAFTADIAITVEGHIGGSESAIINDGQYNLATFAKYHLENGTYGENDIPTDSQLASKKALAVIDAVYAYAAAAEAYVAEQN